MEWKCFFAISLYFLTACDPVLGAPTIINVTLVDGETPNEGRVDYFKSEPLSRESACGDHLGSPEASVICRQFGYPGVNKVLAQWPFGTGDETSNYKLNCMGEEEYLTNCSLGFISSQCSSSSTTGGVICYESGYIGCYSSPASAQSALGDLQTPCENGVHNLTIPKCVSLCHGSDDRYTYAGLYQGNMCVCGNPSTTISQDDRVRDVFCSSSCAGRNIERCGGDSHIAMFNITLYLQNTKRSASPPGCAGTTTTQTEESTLTSSTSLSLSSSSSSSSSSSPPPLPPSPLSPRPTSSSVPSTDRTTVEVMTSDVTPTPRTPTRTTETGVQGNLGLYIGVGASGGIVLLIIIIIILVVFIIRRRRRSKDKGSTSDHTIVELPSDLGDSPPLPFSPNSYSLENGHSNMAADDLTTGTGVEDSDFGLIAETEMNPVNSARNGSTCEDVPRLENTSGSRRPPQPAPRKSTKDTQFTMHPVHELYTTPDESQLSNGHRDSIPENAVSQKFRKEPISQAVPQAPPSALGPEDINGLYTMPDKSRNMTKAKKVLASDMDRPAGIDNALYVCRGEDNLQEGETSNEYATDNDGMETGGEDESDGDTGMVENELYETSYRPT